MMGEALFSLTFVLGIGAWLWLAVRGIDVIRRRRCGHEQTVESRACGLCGTTR